MSLAHALVERRINGSAAACSASSLITQRRGDSRIFREFDADLRFNRRHSRIRSGRGMPLRFFDFRGYDPDKPHLLSKYQGLQPRILLSQYPAVAKLCDEYRDTVLQDGAGKRHPLSSRFKTLASGLLIDERMRRLY